MIESLWLIELQAAQQRLRKRGGGVLIIIILLPLGPSQSHWTPQLISTIVVDCSRRLHHVLVPPPPAHQPRVRRALQVAHQARVLPALKGAALDLLVGREIS